MSANAYLHAASSVPLRGDTVANLLDTMALQHQHGCALISRHQLRHMTYRQLADDVEAIARGLIAMDVEPGDRVGLLTGSCVECVVAQFAVMKAGAVVAHLNPFFGAAELEYVINQCDITTLIAAQSLVDRDVTAMLASIFPELTRTRREAPARAPRLRQVIFLPPDPPKGGVGWSDMKSIGESTHGDVLRQRERAIQFDGTAMILYTSGTTGFPKGAAISHQTIVNTGYFAGSALRFSPADRVCLPVPQYHIFGSVLGTVAAITHGATVVLPNDVFEPISCLRAIRDERCTVLYGVPTMFSAQLSVLNGSGGDYSVESLRTGFMAGAVCSPDLMRQVIVRMHIPELAVSYGMTEASAISQSVSQDAIEDRLFTVGSLLPHMECKIVNPDTGLVVPRGAPGELCVRGYSVMAGYWNDKDSTRGIIDERRWLHTGDFAVMRDDGRIQIVGRIKEVIIRGGEKIQPAEIEQVLRSMSSVKEAYVVGVPHAAYGQEVCACICLRDTTAPVTPDDVRRYCRNRLAIHKVPTHVRFMTAFPTTPTGKIQKSRLCEILTEELRTT